MSSEPSENRLLRQQVGNAEFGIRLAHRGTDARLHSQ
jgi:hypothetical protein